MMKIEDIIHPVCDVCNTKFKSIQVMNVHMKNIHSETDDLRIKRLENFIGMTLQQESIMKKVQVSKSFDCTECGLLFDTQGQQREHYEKNHIKQVIVIEPDTEFLTQNTLDLEIMLKSINQESLFCSAEEFDKDFKDILNEKEDSDNDEISHRYTCVDCKFKASSKKLLRTHRRFVHDLNFFSCQFCGSKTKTTGAMKLHKENVHQSTCENKDTVINLEKEDNDIRNKIESSEEEEEDDSEDEEDIIVDYQYTVDEESGAESDKGNKPSFVESVKAVKHLIQDKGCGYIKKINSHNMIVRDVRHVDYGLEADVEISKGRLRGHLF